ncbi:hypothetical protein CHS0354_038502 [Potamilus streckersoni]|uniref:Uncharacterized protein n=1 Tax=Potamilus streckersoni TaxID=2493646 RepID=A0AAE0VPN1_9BIVA|nr:hypothetical protein CHS0354_038502 [Potamilus streckersoni]
MFKSKKQKNAYIVYDFDAKYSSISEFYNGLITTFLISKLVDRTFLINTDRKCSPASFYRPNLVAWNIAVEKYRHLNLFTHDLSREHNFWKRFENFDFDEIYTTDVVRILANTEHIGETRRHFKSFDRILFLHLLSDSDIIRLIINGLLKPTYSVSSAAKNITSRTEEQPLICFHAEIPAEKKYEDYRMVWNLLHYYSQNISGRSPNIFLSINDSELIEKAKLEFGPNILSVHSGKGILENQEEYCHILFKEIVLLEILKTCQTLIITDTVIGKYAAHMRNPSSNLFCFTGGSSIFRCQRDIVKSDLCWS